MKLTEEQKELLLDRLDEADEINFEREDFEEECLDLEDEIYSLQNKLYWREKGLEDKEKELAEYVAEIRNEFDYGWNPIDKREVRELEEDV